MRPVVWRLLPPALVLAGMTVAIRAGAFAGWPAARQGHALWLLLAAGFLLAWRLRSTRAARASVGLFLLALLVPGGGVGERSEATIQLAQLLVPLDLAAIAWLREATLVSRRGAILFALLGLEAVVLSPWSLGRLAPDPSDLPAWLTAAALGLSCALLVARLASRPSPLAAGWLGILVAVFSAFRAGSPHLWLVAAGLVLVVALVERAFGHAFEDGLTGLPGRRAFDQRLRELGGSFAIAMVDIDHFKRVNDRFGHDVGDQVLSWVATQLRTVRGGTAYRYGGEEFAIVFPGLLAKQAQPHAKALRQQIAGNRFALRDAGRPKRKPRAKRPTTRPRTLQVTVSIGVAARDTKRPTPALVVKAADRALYRAKRAGRDRVAVTGR